MYDKRKGPKKKYDQSVIKRNYYNTKVNEQKYKCIKQVCMQKNSIRIEKKFQQ